MRKRVLLFVALALLVASNAFARERALAPPTPPRTLVPLMYCTPWGGCIAVAWFVYEEVQVVASTGRIDVDWNGNWGSREGCEGCELDNPGPAPEPVDDPGSYGCGDARDNLIAEYSQYTPNGIPSIPVCGDFSNGGSTEHFAWSEMNHSEDNDQTPWGIVTAPLWTGLENTRYDWEDSYGFGAIKVTAGYRSPEINKTTSALAPYTSRHMYGEAADFKPLASDSRSPTWNHDTWLLLKEAAERNDGMNVESWQASSGTHLHVEWR